MIELITIRRAGFADLEGPAFHVPAINHGDGLLAFGFGGHFHKSEPPGLTGGPVGDDFGGKHLAGFGKQRLQVLFGHLVGQVAHVNFYTHYRLAD